MDDHESFKVGADTMESVTKAMNHIMQQDPEINQAAALSGVMTAAFNYVYALTADQEAADEVINNSRQAAIRALQQMPSAARIKAGVALPDDPPEEWQ